MSVAVYPAVPREARQFVTPTFERPEVTATRRDVRVGLASADYIGGDATVSEMKLWGDFDPNFCPHDHAVTEGGSRWIPYQPYLDVVLLAGTGQRTISSRIRTMAGVSTDVMSTVVDLDPEPHLSLLWVEPRRILTGDGKLRFAFSASHAIDAWDVMLAPTTDAAFHECTSVLDGGPAVAGEYIPVALDAADILESDHHPFQSGVKLVRVFMLYDGKWYSGAWTPSFDPAAARWDYAEWDVDYWGGD